MELHQIQVAYQPEEDRILCRASFRDAGGNLQEVRAWLTRRVVKELWPTMLEAMETQVALDNPRAAHASGDVVEMEHHASVEAFRDGGHFSHSFEGDIRSFPLGEIPFLVSNADFSIAAGQPLRMNLMPASGSGFAITFAQQVLHGFSSLLRDAVNNAEWELELALPGSEHPAPASRTLN
ncbi:hypothetical protein [Noviherbaspirillum denitrificans]|uniref:Uncharacterized protein n=1 Tax=Noviherbaspirillum denitrificans TaxID=1968433 RepID=A0A254TK60_9BURK|nr:hypothetical protein [Noviherbaspirillum denitrificans]OWW21702.1 hypothetical protein AYR66_21635 [Noviherbaspirillum denitrificans]